jgi:hypothetical protein
VDTEQITEAPKGKATVNFRFVLPGGEPDGGGPLSIASATFEPTCGLFGGTVVPGSGALRTMSITMQSFLCSETPQACGGDDLRLSSQPTQPAPVDTVRLACGLLKIARGPDGIPLHDQEFTCFEFNGDDHDD